MQRTTASVYITKTPPRPARIKKPKRSFVVCTSFAGASFQPQRKYQVECIRKPLIRPFIHRYTRQTPVPPRTKALNAFVQRVTNEVNPVLLAPVGWSVNSREYAHRFTVFVS